MEVLKKVYVTSLFNILTWLWHMLLTYLLSIWFGIQTLFIAANVQHDMFINLWPFASIIVLIVLVYLFILMMMVWVLF